MCLAESFSPLKVWLKYHLLQEVLPDISRKYFLLCFPLTSFYQALQLLYLLFNVSLSSDPGAPEVRNVCYHHLCICYAKHKAWFLKAWSSIY